MERQHKLYIYETSPEPIEILMNFELASEFPKSSELQSTRHILLAVSLSLFFSKTWTGFPFPAHDRKSEIHLRYGRWLLLSLSPPSLHPRCNSGVRERLEQARCIQRWRGAITKVFTRRRPAEIPFHILGRVHLRSTHKSRNKHIKERLPHARCHLQISANTAGVCLRGCRRAHTQIRKIYLPL